MLKMFDQLGTSDAKKQKMAFPDAGDHIISSRLSSLNHLQVERAARLFLQKQFNVKLN